MTSTMHTKRDESDRMPLSGTCPQGTQFGAGRQVTSQITTQRVNYCDGSEDVVEVHKGTEIQNLGNWRGQGNLKISKLRS